MKNKELGINIITAAKWSTLTEFAAKIVVPITNMILARILTPDAFGVVATVTMIISFADMITDSGFQKYLIQHNFITESEKESNIDVAFWSNLLISFLLWGFIILYSEVIANLVGNPGLEVVIVVAGASLPLTSFSSIQIAIYRRNLDYKTLSYIRILGVIIPFIITIPLALSGYSYWALIIGTICGNLMNAILLTIRSGWKPKLYYNFKVLKKMLSFSIWSLAESISIWGTSYIGTFIVGSILSSYYLGLYKTTMNTVNGIFAIITASTTTLLFSSLSRLQDDDSEYKLVFLKFIKLVAMIVLPIGIGLFVYRDLVTAILLGEQWKEANVFVGIWGLMSCITIVLGQYCSEVYRSKGKPKLSFLAQILHLIVLIPTIIISSKYGFETLIYARSLVKIQQILVNWIIMYFAFYISPLMIIKNVLPSLSASILMGFLAIVLKSLSKSYLWDLVSIGICIIFYFSILINIRSTKSELIKILNNLNLPMGKKILDRIDLKIIN
ncbi:lipopolysaccharide biosynthesis protein [Paraclostridium sordellii]|uniref:lipopolysaccharide biosynthesis protein n=1 Tax=Paraclostridium sordellii TaxID=1505 RepID=UPI0005E707A3|nr:lipopolysaccharide biosynthesis protein [Paeniclostridium sordellii]CEP81823.1 polysaccharide biosynthesis protein [[Clostridium] sordellii] [Paeniclostridium sordellii]